MFKKMILAVALVLGLGSAVYATDCAVQQRVVQFQTVPAFQHQAVVQFVEVPHVQFVQGHAFIQQPIVVQKQRVVVERARVERRPVRARSRSVTVQRSVQR